MQKGLQKGLQEGVEIEARKMAMRLLERRFGKLSLKLRRQIEGLVAEQLEALCEALLDFRAKDDLTRWLKDHPPVR